MCRCEWFSWMDVVKIILPLGWAIFSLCGAIAYGAYGKTITVLASLVSMFMGLILAVDIWFHYSYAKYVILDNKKGNRKRPRDSLWIFQLCVAVFLLIASLLMTYVFIVKSLETPVTYIAESVWTGIGALMALIWTVDLIITTKKIRTTNNVQEYSSEVVEVEVHHNDEDKIDLEATSVSMFPVKENTSSSGEKLEVTEQSKLDNQADSSSDGTGGSSS